MTLFVLCAAQLVLSLDISVVLVANSTIEHALGFSAVSLQWTLSAYALTFGGFLLLGGRTSDLFGRREILIGGLTGFAIASLAAGESRNATELIASRAFQGLCAALVSPAVLSLLTTTFPEGRLRQKAYASWASASSLGGLLGFFVGGALTSLIGWRWIFLINLPIISLIIVLAVFLFEPDRNRHKRVRKLDVPGAVTVTSGLAFVIFGLENSQSASWTAPSTLVALSLGPALIVLFGFIERRAEDPLLPVALLRRKEAVGNVIIVLQQAVVASTVFLLPLYLQQIWRYSAGKAGIASLPLPIAFIIAARLSTRLATRFGAKRLIAAGFALNGLALIWLSKLPVHSAYLTTYLPAVCLRSFGQGLIVIPVASMVTSGVPRRDQGIVAGLFNMSQQLGGALGLAMIATIAAATSTGQGSAILNEAHGIRFSFFSCISIGIIGCIVALKYVRRPDKLSPASASEMGASLVEVPPEIIP